MQFSIDDFAHRSMKKLAILSRASSTGTSCSMAGTFGEFDASNCSDATRKDNENQNKPAFATRKNSTTDNGSWQFISPVHAFHRIVRPGAADGRPVYWQEVGRRAS
jgi:hypothetical protein